MWKCHKCGKPVYFAERKQSLGYDWHPECLRCEECGKRLNPGQHAEHKGVPYCHVPCYGALFGPQLFGHGTRVESHKSYGQKGTTRPVNGGNGPNLPRDILETKLKTYNTFYDSKSSEIRSREVNERLILEGALRVYWGVNNVIHLKEDDDQRTVVTIRKRNSCRFSNSNHTKGNSEVDVSDNSEIISPSVESDISLTDTFDTTESSIPEDSTSSNSSKEISPAHQSSTLPIKFGVKDFNWDEIDDLLQVERKVESTDKLYQTMPSPLPSQSSLDSALSSDNNTSTPDDDSESTHPSSQQTTSNTLVMSNPTSTYEDISSESNTMKACDFDEFKKQMNHDYINGAFKMLRKHDDSLKTNQPIDPSRINDSLKLYSENIMSKSFHGMENNRNYALQKSGSATLRSHVISDDDSWIIKGNHLNRSRSGPNFFENDFSDCDSATLKPSTIKKLDQNPMYIKMDCYDNKKTEEKKNDDSNELPKSDGDDEKINENVNNRGSSNYEDDSSTGIDDGVVLRRPKKGSTAIKRRSGNRRSRTKIKRRCSINGHFYNRETSFFTPPHGSQMSVWLTSLVTTQEVINLLLEKYKVESRPENFALFVIRDNGEQRRLREDDYPLIVRIMLGPHEDVAKLYIVDAQDTPEISSDVAQFLNLSIPECRAILDRYTEEQDKETARIRRKYAEMRRRIIQRMESLKVRL